MFRKSFFLLCLLLLLTFDASGAQAVAPQDSTKRALSNLSGTWSARTSSGVPFLGTWTATPDTTTGAVTGSWTLVDSQGRRVAYGGWSAAKAPTQWNGAWRAIIAGRAGEYSGTWTASIDLKGEARFIELFEKAIQAVMSGTWRAGQQSGAWSIRTSKGDGTP